MSPRKMQSSDLNTMMTKAERQMKWPCFWAIQDVNASKTERKNNKLVILAAKGVIVVLIANNQQHCFLPTGNAKILGSVLVL